MSDGSAEHLYYEAERPFIVKTLTQWKRYYSNPAWAVFMGKLKQVKR